MQRFLGFANYYRWLIRSFGQVAAPITSLLKGGPVRLRWSTEVNRAFSRLKALFTDAPVLAHPDPSLAFMVEVDASEAGVGAMLVTYNVASNTLPCKLDAVYHSAIRFVTKAPYTSHHCDLYALVGWPSLHTRCQTTGYRLSTSLC